MIHDNKIDAYNYMINISIGEYYELVKDYLNDNEYQMKRGKNSRYMFN
jgi:hypothetical protein